jgi:UDP-N-acetylmuramoyl-L-alanyl-D-glutamate--2,6-diaminopimelate ligase
VTAPNPPPLLPVALADLAAAVPEARLVGDPQRAVGEIRFDDRQVRPGDLFVALPGTVDDGARYVAGALARGAAAVVVQEGAVVPEGTTALVVPAARRALGLLSAERYGWPARQLRLIGVTGTDGKTTTTNLIAAILRAAGRRVGVVSTVSAEIAGDQIDTGLHTTTPDAPDLQRYLRQIADAGGEDAVLEVTSHGLAQERVAGCDFDLAIMTNVTGDHLDFHRTFEAYLQAKLRLFENVASSSPKPGIPKGAVYNLEDVSAPAIAALPISRRLGYALDRSADVFPRALLLENPGSSFEAVTPRGLIPITLPLPGRYNVANALAAFGGIPGRLERISGAFGFDVFVDFAHTPNSLEQVLTLARQQSRGRVLVVFGCAGRRDREKRPRMGEIAGRLADRIYLTAEDPRTESLEEILEAIAAGCRQAGRAEGPDYVKEPDRSVAITRAVAEAQPGDLVLVTGKGHERSMCFGQTEVPWCDQDAVRAALVARTTGPLPRPG